MDTSTMAGLRSRREGHHDCPECGGPRTPGVVRIRRPVSALFAAGFVLAYVLGGQIAARPRRGHATAPPAALEGDRAARGAAAGGRGSVHCACRRAVCERCGRRRPVAPLRRRRARRSSPARAPRAARAARPRRRRRDRGGGGRRARRGGVAQPRLVTGGPRLLPTEVEITSPNPRPEWKERVHQELSPPRPHQRLGVGHLARRRSHRRSIEPTAQTPSTGPRRHRPRHHLLRHRARLLRAPTPSRSSGEAMKGHRDKMFLATKFCVADGHLPNDTPVPKIIEAVEASLKPSADRPRRPHPRPLLRSRRAPAWRRTSTRPSTA